MPWYNSKWIIFQLLLSFQLDADFFSFYNPVPPLPPRPKMPLGYVVYICYENSLAIGRLGSEGGTYLKLNLVKW